MRPDAEIAAILRTTLKAVIHRRGKLESRPAQSRSVKLERLKDGGSERSAATRGNTRPPRIESLAPCPTRMLQSTSGAHASPFKRVAFN